MKHQDPLSTKPADISLVQRVLKYLCEKYAEPLLNMYSGYLDINECGKTILFCLLTQNGTFIYNKQVVLHFLRNTQN